WSELELALLLAHDADPVARWLAGKRLAAGVLGRAIEALEQGRSIDVPERLIAAWREVLKRADDEPALAAELLQLPSESELAMRHTPIQVAAIHAARNRIVEYLVDALHEPLKHCYQQFASSDPWQFTPDQVGRRRLANSCLSWLVAGRCSDADALAVSQIQSADNLSDRFAALAALVRADSDCAQAELDAFAVRYQHNPLVMDKWFALQAMRPIQDTVEQVKTLMQHEAFSLKNPNKVRALIGSFGMHNPVAFHREDGAGCELLADVVYALDAINPQVAARLVAVFNRWSEYAEPYQSNMQTALNRILAKPGLSSDVNEIAGAALKRARS
ncbi:MAG: aminopeptidase N C-terminal domain-containing protein, partial [Pseudomonadota bacterium]